MTVESTIEELLRRQERTDNHIVDINKQMLDIKRDVDDKFDVINQNLLRIVAGGNKKDVSSDGAWVRQSVGLSIAVVTILGFSITTFHSMLRPLEIQFEIFQKQAREDLKTLHGHVNDGHPYKVEHRVSVLERLSVESERKIASIENGVSVLQTEMKYATEDRYKGVEAKKDKEISDLKDLIIQEKIKKDQPL